MDEVALDLGLARAPQIVLLHRHAGQHVVARNHAVPGEDLGELERERIERARELGLAEEERERKARLLPPGSQRSEAGEFLAVEALRHHERVHQRAVRLVDDERDQP